MSRRKQQKPQHFYDDEDDQPSGMHSNASLSPHIDVTDDYEHADTVHRGALMDDAPHPDAPSTAAPAPEHGEHTAPHEYGMELAYSDNESLSDADSNPRDEHRDASDEDCMKDDYKEDYETSRRATDLSPVSELNRSLGQYPQSMSPPEIAMIQSTLYSLQQQQILQLHLIQQLHQHLVAGTLPSALPSLMALPPLPALTSASSVTSQPITSLVTTSPSYTMPTMMTPSSGMQPPFRSHLAELETMTNKPVSMEDEKSKSVKLEALNRSSSGDEAYFKHRCKYCHKIFGSESALQIHIRSHTGERPFKCNICGNRFTTRGNLKVHFARHKQKYPHIQMNPNPVPEHLDKILPPPLASITNVNDLPPRSLAPTMTVASMIAPKKEQRSPSPVHNETERAKTPDQNSTPIPLPSSLPPFGPGYETPNFINRPSAKYEDPFEQFMEFDKSETTKLQQLVENLEHKMSDPNQCIICHRILSCKSALQMHYRTHTGERPFRCRICGRSFTTKGNLKTHMGVHRAKPPIRMMHKCPICHKEFTNSIVLQQHVRLHTPDMAGLDLATKVTAFKEFTPQYLIPPRPYAGSAPPTPMSGLDLSKSSDNTDTSREERKEQSLSEESTTGHDDSDLPLAKRPRLDLEEEAPKDDSSEQFEDTQAHESDVRAQYRSLHDLEERVQAMSRNFPDSQPLDMSAEQRMDGRSRSISPVSNCNSENNESGSSSYHDFRTTSPGASFGALDLTSQTDRGTNCAICNKSFACRSALEIHYRSHTKERPFECQVCHRSFTTKSNMKQHLLTHKIRDMKDETEDKHKEQRNDIENNNSPTQFLSPPSSNATSTPIFSGSYSSPTPSTPTTPNSSSNSTSASPFVRRPNNKHLCQICQKPFSSASALQIHMRTHTGQKPYKCEVCGKAFTTKGNLKVHMGTHMWNNGPSRRGRRIAMDSPIPMPTKEGDFMFHRTPELYFPYPAFPAGLSPKFGNEIPVIQGMNGNFPHYSTPVSASDYMKLAAGYTPPQMPHDAILKSYSAMTGDKDMTPIRNNNNESEADRSTSDRSASDENQSDQSPPASGADSVWSWKTTCHLCNKVCVSVAALEIHLQSHIMKHEEVKPVMTESNMV